MEIECADFYELVVFVPKGEGGAVLEDVGDDCTGVGFWIVGIGVCVPRAWGEGDDPVVEALGVLGVDCAS